MSIYPLCNGYAKKRHRVEQRENSLMACAFEHLMDKAVEKRMAR
jgi:hypothetical protein